MITIKDWMEGVQYRVTDNWDFQWQCFGSNAMVLESDWDGGRTYTITYDKTSLEVYEVCSYSQEECTGLRWLNPDYKKAYFAEEKRKGMWDITHFTEVKSHRGWSWLTKMFGF